MVIENYYIANEFIHSEHGLFVTTNGEEFKYRLQFLQSSNGSNRSKTTLLATLNGMGNLKDEI